MLFKSIQSRSRRGRLLFILFLIILLLGILNIRNLKGNKPSPKAPEKTKGYAWTAPDTALISAEPNAELIRYGRNLVAYTSYYLGPNGKVKAITNGMNCQNCHLDAGTKLYGNNYSAVFSTYPRFRERSGTVENIYKRVNDCLERSLNGTVLDTNGLEMQAFAAYINWVGKTVPKEVKPVESGISNLPYLDRPADPEKGKIVYSQKCSHCHGVDGKGVSGQSGGGYVYPPLWGDRSYTTAAGLYRVSRFAGFVRNNMPFLATHDSSKLTNEQAWDVAAFVNSMPRPVKQFAADWPNIAGKPVDHPYGPFADNFSEEQHKYGPFQPIADAAAKNKASAKK